MDADAVRQAYMTIQATVSQWRGAEHFQGVTVQPMMKLAGYELIIGSSIDPQCGPVLLFGTGGTLVEVYRDRALALPPLNTTLARRMMEQTRIFSALQGVRGRKPVDLDALERLLVRFSQLVVEQPWIKEVEINPLLASPERLIALDARIVLHELKLRAEERPRPAIRPYPARYIAPFMTQTHMPVTIRPIRPEDEPLMDAFNRTLSPTSIYLRYFHSVSPLHLTAHEQLARLCFIDYDREMILVAERQHDTGAREILALGQLTRLHGNNEAEFAILVSDQHQRTGLGKALLRCLLDFARDEKIERVIAEILPENEGMKRVSLSLGFKLQWDRESGVVQAALDL